MSENKQNQPCDGQGKGIGREPVEIIKDIQHSGDMLMATVGELIEWTDCDISRVIGYLKRIGNFLEAVIEAHPKTYQVGDLMEKLAVDEPSLRKLLYDVGTDIDVTKNDLEEVVKEGAIIDLLADRAGSDIGDRLMALIRGDGPYMTWS
jgi:hypothetical protein